MHGTQFTIFLHSNLDHNSIQTTGHACLLAFFSRVQCVLSVRIVGFNAITMQIHSTSTRRRVEIPSKYNLQNCGHSYSYFYGNFFTNFRYRLRLWTDIHQRLSRTRSWLLNWKSFLIQCFIKVFMVYWINISSLDLRTISNPCSTFACSQFPIHCRGARTNIDDRTRGIEAAQNPLQTNSPKNKKIG